MCTKKNPISILKASFIVESIKLGDTCTKNSFFRMLIYLGFAEGGGLGIEKNNEWWCVQVVNIIVYSLIPLLLFGVADTMDMVDWDWVTPQTNSLLRKSTICLQLFQFLLVHTSVCLLMQMEVFGAVDTINVDNWDWRT